MDVRKEVIDVMQDRLCLEDAEVQKINDDTQTKDIIVDSLDMMDIIQHIEIKLGIKVPDPPRDSEERTKLVSQMETFGGIVSVVDDLVQVKT